MLTLKMSGNLFNSSGLFVIKYLQLIGILGKTFTNKFSKSFSKTTACYLNLFFVLLLVNEKLYEFTIFIEHKSSSNFVAFIIKSGTGFNFIFCQS